MAPGTTCQKQGGAPNIIPTSLYLRSHTVLILLNVTVPHIPVSVSPHYCLPIPTSPFPHLHIVPKSLHFVPISPNFTMSHIPVSPSPCPQPPHTSPYYPHVPKCPPEVELLGHTRVPAEFVSLEGKRLSVRIKEQEEVWGSPKAQLYPIVGPKHPPQQGRVQGGLCPTAGSCPIACLCPTACLLPDGCSAAWDAPC